LLPEGCDRSPEGLCKRREALERILIALAAACPSLGYCQGLHLLAAFAMSVAEESGRCRDSLEAEVFAFLAGVLEMQDLRSWWEPPLIGLRAAVAALSTLLHERLPELAAHFVAEGVAPELVAVPWLQTLFSGLSPMPRATTCRLWECWLLDGTPKIFFRTALALFKNAEGVLLSEPIEQAVEMLRIHPAPLDQGLHASQILPSAWAYHITNRQLRSVLSSAKASLREASDTGVLLKVDAPNVTEQLHSSSPSKEEVESEMIEAADIDKVAPPDAQGQASTGNLLELEELF
jgi:hypothetical protein